MATLSIRLDAKTASTVDRITARTGKTKSEIVREAITDYAGKVEKKSKGQRPFDKVAHLIGACDSGGMQLSTRTGERFTEMLLKQEINRGVLIDAGRSD